MTVPRDWYRGRQGSCFEYQLRPFPCTVLTWLTRDAIFFSISTLVQAYFIASAVSYLYSIDKNVFQKVFNIILDSIFFLHFLRNCNPVYPLNAYTYFQLWNFQKPDSNHFKAPKADLFNNSFLREDTLRIKSYLCCLLTNLKHNLRFYPRRYVIYPKIVGDEKVPQILDRAIYETILLYHSYIISSLGPKVLTLGKLPLCDFSNHYYDKLLPWAFSVQNEHILSFFGSIVDWH